MRIAALKNVPEYEHHEERDDGGNDLLWHHAGTPLDRGSIRASRSRLSIPVTISVAAIASSRLPIGRSKRKSKYPSIEAPIAKTTITGKTVSRAPAIRP